MNLRFLLARLHMDSLMSQPTLGHIKRAMRSLPQGVKGLDETYEQAIKRIESQEEGYRKLAKQVLSWVTHANRALSTAEVQHALAVTVDMTDLDRDFLPEVEILGSICAGLITIDEKSDIIRLVHYTTREYFERMSSFPNADADIAMICVTYLSFDNFATGFCSTDKEFEARLRSHQLYSYAACNWGHHAYAASTVLEQPIMNLLESEAKMLASSQAMMVLTSYRNKDYSQRVPMQMTGMHIAAYFGLREVMIALLKNGHNPDVRNSYARTPLSYAAERGSEAVVRLLLERADVEADSKEDRWGRTPLWRAAANGHEAVVRLLLERADVEADSKEDRWGRTPLSWAASNGHEAVVRLLLERADVEADSKDDSGRTPLWWATANGHEAVVRLLLERADVEADSKDDSGRTSLSWAAANGHEAVVRLLLERADVEADSKDRWGRTPLWLAAASGHEAVVRLLLERADVEADSKDVNDQTPLSRAAAYGHEAVIRLLQSHDSQSS
jgi:ankyrin repeat protein